MNETEEESLEKRNNALIETLQTNDFKEEEEEEDLLKKA